MHGSGMKARSSGGAQPQPAGTDATASKVRVRAMATTRTPAPRKRKPAPSPRPRPAASAAARKRKPPARGAHARTRQALVGDLGSADPVIEQRHLDLFGLALVACGVFLVFPLYLGWDGGQAGDGVVDGLAGRRSAALRRADRRARGRRRHRPAARAPVGAAVRSGGLCLVARAHADVRRRHVRARPGHGPRTASGTPTSCATAAASSARPSSMCRAHLFGSIGTAHPRASSSSWPGCCC